LKWGGVVEASFPSHFFLPPFPHPCVHKLRPHPGPSQGFSQAHANPRTTDALTHARTVYTRTSVVGPRPGSLPFLWRRWILYPVKLHQSPTISPPPPSLTSHSQKNGFTFLVLVIYMRFCVYWNVVVLTFSPPLICVNSAPANSSI
jgi:hypothetical protein